MLLLDHGRFELVLTVGDTSLTSVWLEAKLEGTIEITGPSKVEGAQEILIRYTKKQIRRRTQDLAVIQRLDLSRCLLDLDRWVDVSHVGCSWVLPLEAHAKDFDLLAVEGDLLRFGGRSAAVTAPSPERRPRYLGPPLRRERGGLSPSGKAPRGTEAESYRSPPAPSPKR
ncbi:MAG: hypothetical protein U1E65_23185 [Myxococcota bacterium]